MLGVIVTRRCVSKSIFLYSTVDQKRHLSTGKEKKKTLRILEKDCSEFTLKSMTVLCAVEYVPYCYEQEGLYFE